MSGLTTAVVLAEAGVRVHVIAAEWPGRTSLAAGAMWGALPGRARGEGRRVEPAVLGDLPHAG
ncbi:hypothetical protein [Streptomyces sp. NBC_01476]|uniref:hypothetical protein n=1 Tax=Streptomyces sp. NBC_01476 TaxID=2903881 RepID=UPI002E37EA11|nr:hypothetical protein [Streptomyces sp. NBC_01476]